MHMLAESETKKRDGSVHFVICSVLLVRLSFWYWVIRHLSFVF